MLKHIVVLNGRGSETARAWAQLIAGRAARVVDVTQLRSASPDTSGATALQPAAPHAVPGASIESAVESTSTDLLVIGLDEEVDGRLDGVGGRVADRARAPVLLVPPPPPGTAPVPPAQPRSLLVALDAATFTNGVLESATELAGLFGAGLWLLHADMPYARGSDRPAAPAAEGGGASARYLGSLSAGRGPPGGGAHVQSAGAATTTTAILEAARAVDADLIVMAPLRSATHVLEEGGAVRDVLRTTRRPVLLARPR